jgi:two-component system sensor histidine kinase QseC
MKRLEPARPPDAAFFLLTSAAWGIASVVAWQQTTDKLDKLFDTQQLLFARRLSAMNFDELRAPPACAEKKKVKHGHLDDDALAFAIFTRDGKMVLNDGENGEDIPWNIAREGSAMAICATTMTSGASCG